MMRFIGAGGVWQQERVDDVMGFQLRHWALHGFGWYTAFEEDGGAMAGFMGLNFLGEGTKGLSKFEYEIGWWVDPDRWGRGYAREGGRALADEAFASLHAPSVIARIRPENGASLKVAAKLGMRHEFDTTGTSGEPCSVFRLERPA